MTAVTALTADAVNAIQNLVKREHVEIYFEPLPAEALGGDTRVKAPHVAIIRKGDTIEMKPIDDLVEAARGKPFARIGTAKAATLKSFIALLNHHKRPETVVFADTNWRKPSFTAVLDYHATTKGEAVALNDAGARFGKHRIAYEFPLSDAWKIWVAQNGQAMGQADFAEFLEEHVHEIAAPEPMERSIWEPQFKAAFATPNELIDLARGLEVRVNSKVVNKTRLQSGETQLVYETEHTDADGRELVVPGLFLLSVAPFHRGEAIRLPVRLRYRAIAGGIAWSFQMFRPDQFIDERLADDMDEVARETGAPVFHGQPEN